MSAPQIPPFPWSKFDDGEPLGWIAAGRWWKSWLLPYRTAELIGMRNDPPDMILGPWEWHAPDLWRQIRGDRDGDA